MTISAESETTLLTGVHDEIDDFDLAALGYYRCRFCSEVHQATPEFIKFVNAWPVAVCCGKCKDSGNAPSWYKPLVEWENGQRVPVLEAVE